MARRIPEPIAKELQHWKATARFYTFAHYILGSLAIVSSVLAAFKPANSTWMKGLVSLSSLVSAMCAGFVTFFGFDRSARAHRRAADMLSQACIEFQVDPTKTEMDLLKSYRQAIQTRNVSSR